MVGTMILPVMVMCLGQWVVLGLELGSNSRRGGMKREEIAPGKLALNVGLIVPFSNFLRKNYDKNIGSAVNSIKKRKYSWSNTHYLGDEQVHLEMMSINPSPTGGQTEYCNR